MSKQKRRDGDEQNPVTVLRPHVEAEAKRLGLAVDEASLAAAQAYCDEQLPEERQRDPITVPDRQEVRTMVDQQPAKTAQRIYRCIYDDAATARVVTDGAPDPDVFCQVCGNRMVRERN